jgi:hypothetical protein
MGDSLYQPGAKEELLTFSVPPMAKGEISLDILRS